MNLEKLCSDIIESCRSLGSELLEKQKELKTFDIKSKGVHDLVTKCDFYSEKILVKRLSELIPESGFIAEEGTSTKKGEVYNWIVDPIDGTTNFIHGIPCFSISIALQEKDKTILGVVYEMNLDEAFYSFEGAPAYLNNKIIKVSSCQILDDSLLATGFPYTDFNKTDNYLRIFKHFMENSRGLRRLGSAAVDLAYVACGRFDGFYEYGLNAWDVAAGGFIVRQAGGVGTDFDNTENFTFGRELIAGNTSIHQQMIEPIKKYF